MARKQAFQGATNLWLLIIWGQLFWQVVKVISQCMPKLIKNFSSYKFTYNG